MAKIYSILKWLFTAQRIKFTLEILAFVVLVSTLIVGGYTILGMTFSELYNLDDKLQTELQNNDELNKMYLQTRDPIEKVQFMLNGKKFFKWSTIHELKARIFSSEYFNKTKPLRTAYNFCIRILSLTERVYYTFHPTSPVINFLNKYALGFNANKYGAGIPWINAWIREISSHPIFLVAFYDYIQEGGVEKDLCVELKTIIKQGIEKENNVDSINKIFPELFALF